MKIIFDKIMEYAMKELNKALNAVVAALPSSLRYQFADMKQVLTELILCLYNKLMENLCELIESALNDAIDPEQLEQDVLDAIENNDPTVGCPTNPIVPMCYAESITAQVIASSQEDIDSANNNLIDNLNAYLDDVNEMLAGIEGFVSDIQNSISDISGSLTSALSFTNIQLNVFGCELSPNVAVSDIYTFCSGGDSTPPAATPSEKSVADGVESQSPATTTPPAPYVEPTKAEQTLEHNPEDKRVEAGLPYVGRNVGPIAPFSGI